MTVYYDLDNFPVQSYPEFDMSSGGGDVVDHIRIALSGMFEIIDQAVMNAFAL